LSPSGVSKRIGTMRRTANILIAAAIFCGLSPGGGDLRAAVVNADLRKKADLYDSIVRKIANRYVVDPALVHSIIAAESNYDRFAVSNKGALGLMQLMPETARTYGVSNAFDIAQNIEGGVKFLRDLLKAFPGRTELVLAAYNAGPEAVAKYEGVPPFAETKTYIARVKRYLREISPARRARIIETVDKDGRLIVTNDPRLAYR
jgi:soluble lytic murein transglycosylase-like protein